MGESQHTLFPLEFNKSLLIEAREERLTSEAGAVLLREAIEQLGLTTWLAKRLVDTRDSDFITYPFEELLRTSLVLLGQGWRDQDDADALRHDAVLRLAVSSRRGLAPLWRRPEPEDDRPLSKNPAQPDGLASQPTLSRLFRTLSTDANRAVLREGLLETVSRRIKAARGGHRKRRLTVDVDSLPIAVSGHQPGSAYNGHYHERIYHPLVATVAETGDLIDARLRAGNVHTASGALEFILPLLDRVEQTLCQVAALRLDAGFPDEELLHALEARGTLYVARVKNNAVLDRMAEEHLKRPRGRPPAEPRTWFYEYAYRAESWSRARRVALVVQERPGELFLHHFWLITNRTEAQMSAEALLEEYRERGTAEGHMGELMDVLDPALSSAPRQKSHYRHLLPAALTPAGDSFAINEVVLLLNALAYDVAHAVRVQTEAATGEGWSLRRLRERVLRVAGRVLVHGRRAVLIIAGPAVALWQRLGPRLRLLRLAES